MKTPLNLTRDEWSRVLRLLDAALERPAVERAAWLAALPAEHAPLAPALARLLEQRAAIETDDFLARGARFEAQGATADDRFAAGATVGPYRLLRPLGSGGMATVWLAERADASIARPVALKLPLLAGRPRALAERFERERAILSALVHPNIAAVIDAGVDGGQPWLALEAVEGRPITAHCVERELPIADRLRLAVQVLRALQYAHAQLVIHRDIKPSNVLVDAHGAAKLLDFGVAKLLQPDGSAEQTALTQWGGRALTPQYASPEQIAGRPLGTASDVYSAGVLLYELLTGRRPYRLARDTPAALEEAILAAQIVAPSKAAADKAVARALAGDIDAIVSKALAHAPGERYASAGAFADDIERHLTRRPIAARAPSRWYLASRFVQRHRIGLVATVAVGLALAGGLGAALWQAERAEREAQRAGTIKDFLVSVFTASDPRQPDGERSGQVTARELLDRSVGRIEREFAADAPTAIELLGLTSEIYCHLQLPGRCEELLARRIALAQRHYGERHPIVVQARLIDAWSSIWKRDYTAARRQLDAIDALIGATRGARTLEAAEWWLAHRSAYETEAGAFEQRLQALERARALFESLDPGHPSIAVSLANMGQEWSRIERLREARDHYAQAAAAFVRGRQADAGDLAVIELHLGQLQAALGDFKAAEQSLAAAYAKGQRMHGATGLWGTAAGYAQFLHQRGERARAHEVFAAALKTLPAGASPNGREAGLLRAWGAALLAEGRAADALPALQSAWQHAQQRPGSDEDPRVAALLLARAHTALGQADAARPLFERALDDFARHAPGSIAEAAARVHWADFLAAQREAAAAESAYRAVMDAAGDRAFEALPRARLGLARLAAERGDVALAARLAEQARADAERLNAGHDVRLHAEAWRTLAQIALQRGDRAGAARWAERALAASERHDGAEALSVRTARDLLTRAGRSPP